MSYILVKNNVVVNIIEAETDFIDNIRSEYQLVTTTQIHPDAKVGSTWDGTSFTDPVPSGEILVLTPPEDPRWWWVHVGPFKDRLGMDALAISVSSADVCIAVKEMLYDRLYIDLKDPKVAMMLNMLIAMNEPVANAIFPGSGPMTLAKLEGIVNTPTTESERYVKNLAA